MQAGWAVAKLCLGEEHTHTHLHTNTHTSLISIVDFICVTSANKSTKHIHSCTRPVSVTEVNIFTDMISQIRMSQQILDRIRSASQNPQFKHHPLILSSAPQQFMFLLFQDPRNYWVCFRTNVTACQPDNHEVCWNPTRNIQTTWNNHLPPKYV